MERNEIIELLKERNAIINGHFVLSSGLHSDTYIQCAQALMVPSLCTKLCERIVARIKDSIDTSKLTTVLAPAMGGVIIGHEIARQLDLPSMFCERVNGTFELRRGFQLSPSDNVLVVEDVVTTGKSSLETFKCIESYGANIVAEASLINRSGKSDPLGGVPLISLLALDVATYDEAELPDALASVPVEKPGSRFLQKAS